MSEPILRLVIPALWLAWLIYWQIAARNVKETRWTESLGSRAIHLTPLFLAAYLLFADHLFIPTLGRRFLPNNLPVFIVGAVLVAAGLGFATWARLHLGRNWSAMVTLKEQHSLIRTGPYTYVR